MADSACYIELASNNGDFFTNSTTDDIMIRPQYATQDILIGTSNGISTLTITSNNVGIGKNTPSYTLDVNGDINFTGAFRQNGTPYIGSQWSNNNANVFLLGSNVGIGTTSPTAPLHITATSGDPDVNALHVYNPSTNATSNAVVSVRTNGATSGNPYYSWDINGVAGWSMGISNADSDKLVVKNNWSFIGDSNVMTMTTSGNVGIGTSTPAYKLDVSGPANITYTGVSASFTVSNNSSPYIQVIGMSNSVLTIGASGSAGTHSTDAIAGDVVIKNQQLTTTGRIMFQAGNGASAICINSNNTVGIGTTTPAYKLDVSGDIRASGEIISTSANNFRMVQGNYGIFGRNDGADYYTMITASGSPYGVYNSLRPMRINLATGNVYFGNEALYVQHGGNVGIGTTSPSYKLDVNGTTRLNNTTAIYGGNGVGGGAILSLRNTATANDPRWIFRGPDWGNNAGLFIGYNECNDTSFTSGVNGGNPAMNIRAVGSYYTVGIGTSGNSSFALQVNGTYGQYGQTASFVYSNVNTLIGAGDVATRYNGLVKQGDSFIVGYSNAINTGGLVLGTWSAGMSGIRVDGPTGYVGVGSSNPAYKLDVVGDIITTWIRSRNNAGWYNETYGGGFYMTDTTWVRTYGTKNFFHDGSIMRTDGQLHVGNGGSTFLCSNGGDFAYRTNVLFANTVGNVGIGTASPAYKLDVAGTINATSYSNVSYFYLKDQPSQIWRSDLLGTSVNSAGYFKIATLQDINSGANGTGVNIRGWAGPFGTKMKFECIVSTRGGVNMKAYTSGSIYDNATDIMIYQETDNTFSLYFWNNSYYATWWFEASANTSYGATLLTPSATRTTPTGTLSTAMSSNLVTVATGTNFGIGTSNPSANIHINNDLHIAANSGSWNTSAGKGIYMRYSTTGSQDAAYLQSITRSTSIFQNLAIQASNIQLSSGSDIGTSSPPFYMRYDGNIGIGTNTPSYKLDVSGGTRFNNPAGQSATAVMTLENSTSTNKIGMFVNLTQGSYNGCVAAGDSAIITGLGSTDTGSLVLGVWGGSNAGVKIDKTGFIGIGTSYPSYKLDIVGSNIRIKTSTSVSGEVMELRLASAANTAEQRKGFIQRLGFYGREEYTTNEQLDAAIDVLMGSNLHYPTYPGASSTQFIFSTRNWGSSYGERMRLTPEGNLGIGTATPLSQLDVNGDTVIRGRAIIGNSNYTLNTQGTFNVYNPGSLDTGGARVWITASNQTHMTIGKHASVANGDGYIWLPGAHGLSIGTNDTERIKILSSGNVGIGTGTPSSTLHVSGNSILNGGNQIVVQNSQDGGTGRGIYMWALADTNWGIYMASSGANKSLSGGTAVAGNGFSSHAIRFRVNNSTNNGFIFENNSEGLLMSIRGDGLTYIAGNTTAYNASIGNAGHGAAFAAFCHSNQFNTTGYSLLHQDNGTTYLNCASGTSIRFRETNSDIAIITGSKMGILTTSPSYQLHVVGTIYATGDIIGFSDIRLKSNITIIDSALSKIHKLNGYTFNIQDDEKAHTGLIAQEVLEVLPEAVHQEKKADGTDGYYSLAYGNMAGLFVEAIKEIDNKYKAQITELQETISMLKHEIDLLKNK